MEEPRPTLIDYLVYFPDEETHPEVERFIRNLLILLEHEYFAEPEYPEDTAEDQM